MVRERAASASASGSSWTGGEDLQQALDGLKSAKGTSAKRIRAVATTALKHAKDYKRVVHDVESFLWKSDPKYRLGGLYAIDAIIRQSQAKSASKDPFLPRFSLHLSTTISAVKKIPQDQQHRVEHIIHEWQSRNLFQPSQLQEAGGDIYVLPRNKQKDGPKATGADEQDDQQSSKKLASLLSIIKKQKERQDPHETPEPRSGRPRARSDSMEDDRSAKKAKGSRWGPAKPSGQEDRRSPPPMNYPPPPPGSGWMPPRGPPEDKFYPPTHPSPRGNYPPPPPMDRGPGSRGPPPPMNHRYDGHDAHPFGDATSRPDGKTPNSSGQLCRKFQQGRCNFGDLCWHVHDADGEKGGMETDRSKSKVCNHHLRGQCRFGDKCNFSHEDRDTGHTGYRDNRSTMHQGPPPYRDDPSPRGFARPPPPPFTGSKAPHGDASYARPDAYASEMYTRPDSASSFQSLDPPAASRPSEKQEPTKEQATPEFNLDYDDDEE